MRTPCVLVSLAYRPAIRVIFLNPALVAHADVVLTPWSLYLLRFRKAPVWPGT